MKGYVIYIQGDGESDWVGERWSEKDKEKKIDVERVGGREREKKLGQDRGEKRKSERGKKR